MIFGVLEKERIGYACWTRETREEGKNKTIRFDGRSWAKKRRLGV
jgi:hypothetical protein